MSNEDRLRSYVKIRQELDRVSSRNCFIAAESARGRDITAVVLWGNCIGNRPDAVLLIYCIYVCTYLYRGCAWSVHSHSVRIKQELDRVSSRSGFVAAEGARGRDMTTVVLWCNCVGNSP